jgi:hypothetical protein
MENDNSYPRLRALLQKQIAASDLRSSRDLVRSCPLLQLVLPTPTFTTTHIQMAENSATFHNELPSVTLANASYHRLSIYTQRTTHN